MSWNRPATREGVAKAAIKQFLRFSGWEVITIQQGPLCDRGMSDLIGIKSGVVVFIEIKAPEGPDRRGKVQRKGELSDHQKSFRDRLDAKGGLYRVLRTVEDAEKLNREAMGMVNA